jgi:DoxX-like family
LEAEVMSACNKTVTLYALQAVLAVLIIASGLAKLSGAGFMVQPLELLGLSRQLLTGIGILEMVAGAYLLLPRGAILGTVLLGEPGCPLGAAAALLRASRLSAFSGTARARCLNAASGGRGNGLDLDQHIPGAPA